MKKILSVLAAAMLFAMGAMAQASFGIGYMNPNHLLISDNLNGVYAGLDYNILLSENIGIAPGVYYSYNSTSSNEVESIRLVGVTFSIPTKHSLSEHYIGVPVNLNYSLKLAPDFAIVLYAGPTFSYGIISKVKKTTTVQNEPVSEVDNLYEDANYKPFDVLLGGGVAFDWAETFRVALGYNYGVLDRNANMNASYKRNYFHMGVAYLF